MDHQEHIFSAVVAQAQPRALPGEQEAAGLSASSKYTMESDDALAPASSSDHHQERAGSPQEAKANQQEDESSRRPSGRRSARHGLLVLPGSLGGTGWCVYYQWRAAWHDQPGIVIVEPPPRPGALLTSAHQEQAVGAR